MAGLPWPDCGRWTDRCHDVLYPDCPNIPVFLKKIFLEQGLSGQILDQAAKRPIRGKLLRDGHNYAGHNYILWDSLDDRS